ncbi:Hsp70 family protein [Hamadaea sp. NPDC050747]|uniref:Hsp70 family protein n=1 Tax=Hamadaea sp. NPDC050747 TaxID=3155789 RepID=UPI0033D7123C
MNPNPRTSILALPYTAAAQIPTAIATPRPAAVSDQAEASDDVSTMSPEADAPTASHRAGARLAIDVGADSTRALLEIDGRRIPLTFDGNLAMPTPRVDVGDRLVDVKTALQPATDSSQHGPAKRVYQTLLQRQAVTAGVPIQQLVLTVPPTWGPQRRDLVRRAATDAGLPAPVIVSEAAAAAEATMPHTGQDGIVLVCDLGTRGHLTVLRRTDRGWNQLATTTSDTYAGHGLDQAMAHALSPEHADHPALLARCASARLDLHAQAAVDDAGATAIRIPDQDLAAIYHFDDLTQLTTDACAQIVAAARDVLAAAELTPGSLAGIVVRGGAAATIIPGGELRAAFDVTPVEPIDPHLLCHGALTLAPTPVAAAPAIAAKPRRWLKPGHLAAIVVPAILGAHLATQEIDETFTYTDRLRSYRDIYDYQKIQVLFDRPSFAVAGWCLMLSAIAAGTLLVHLLHQHDTDEATPGRHTRTGGQIQIYSVVIGLAIVLVQGMLGYAIIGGPPLDVPRFPLIALAGAVAPATIVLLVGLLAPLSARLRVRGWTDRLHHPISGPLLAACGCIAGNLYFDTPRILDWLPLAPGGDQRIKAVLVGIAIAITLVNHIAARTVLAFVLATGAFLATGDYYTVWAAGDQLTKAYLAVVALWWIRHAVKIALDLHPNGLRRVWQTITRSLELTPAQPGGDSRPPTVADRDITDKPATPPITEPDTASQQQSSVP